jgi:hypothetical protein
MKGNSKFKQAKIYRLAKRMRLLLLSACFVIPIIGWGQELAAEDELLDCVRDSFPGDGQTLDSLMVVFESELIIEGLMESRSAEDYRGLLQRIASEQAILREMDSYFFTRFRNLTPDSSAILSCVESIERYAAQFPEERLGQTLNLRAESMGGKVPPSDQASAFLDILGVSDFELPIYRFLTYHIIDGQAYETATTNPSADAFGGGGSDRNYGANMLQVRMNTQNQLVSNDQLISDEELLSRVQMHARRFEEQAIYVVEIEDDVKYTSFITLKDKIALAITQVRDDYARRYLGKTLTELTEEEQEVVFFKYPLRIVSP